MVFHSILTNLTYKICVDGHKFHMFFMTRLYFAASPRFMTECCTRFVNGARVPKVRSVWMAAVKYAGMTSWLLLPSVVGFRDEGAVVKTNKRCSPVTKLMRLYEIVKQNVLTGFIHCANCHENNVS